MDNHRATAWQPTGERRKNPPARLLLNSVTASARESSGIVTATMGIRLVQHDENNGPSQPEREWRDMRGREETHAFIVRLRITVRPDGTRAHPLFSLEDVSAGRTTRHGAFSQLAEHLATRVQAIIAGPVDDRGAQ